MRLLQVTLGTAFVCLMLFISVRLWGEGQTYRPYESAFWHKNEASPFIIIPWEQNYFLEKNPNWILWADVYRGDNQDILVRPWIERDLKIKDLERTPSPARPLLVELLKKYPQARWVINCNHNVQDIHLQLAKIFTETGSSEKIILQSDYNTILISTKDKAPLVLYGSTPADLTRLKVFDSLWLLPAAPFKGDLFISAFKYRNIPTLNRDIALELKKRFKKIILGPLSNETEIQQAMELSADGLFIVDPILWKK